jgi:hypothetical protein
VAVMRPGAVAETDAPDTAPANDEMAAAYRAGKSKPNPTP